MFAQLVIVILLARRFKLGLIVGLIMGTLAHVLLQGLNDSERVGVVLALVVHH